MSVLGQQDAFLGSPRVFVKNVRVESMAGHPRPISLRTPGLIQPALRPVMLGIYPTSSEGDNRAKHSSSNHRSFLLVRHQITTSFSFVIRSQLQITTSSFSFVIKSQFSSRSSSNHNFSLVRHQITTSFSFVIKSQLLSRSSSYDKVSKD